MLDTITLLSKLVKYVVSTFVCWFVLVFVCFFFLQTSSHYVALAGLEVTVSTRTDSNS